MVEGAEKEKGRGKRKRDAMNRAPTTFGIGKSGERKRKRARPFEAQGKRAVPLREYWKRQNIKKRQTPIRLFEPDDGGRSVRPGRPRGLRGLLRGCFVGLGGL